MKASNHTPVLDANEELQRKFSRGEGVVLISPDMADEVIVRTIRTALRVSQGKPFTVMAPPTT